MNEPTKSIVRRYFDGEQLTPEERAEFWRQWDEDHKGPTPGPCPHCHTTGAYPGGSCKCP